MSNSTKRIIVTGLVFSIVGGLLLAEALPDNKFQELSDSEQMKSIDAASGSEKEHFKNLARHLYLVKRAGGEQQLEAQRERVASRRRGFSGLLLLIPKQLQMFQSYNAAAHFSDLKAGMGVKEQISAIENRETERSAINARQEFVNVMIANLAPSPAAFELEKRVENWISQKDNDFQLKGRNRQEAKKPNMIAVQWSRAKMEVDQFVSELKSLPKLTPDEVKSERDSVTDDMVLPGN